MYKRIVLFIYICCFIIIVYVDSFADEGKKVSLDGQDFSAEAFFELKGMGFVKDKVNFNKGWLGVFMEDAEGKGIMAKEVVKGSPSDIAGIKAGDIITKINGETTIGKEGENLIKFKKTVETIGAGGSPAITVLRDGNEIVFNPKLVAKLLRDVKERNDYLVSTRYPGTGTASAQACESEATSVKEKNSSDKIGFMEFALRYKKYRDKVGELLQRIGEEIYVREGFQKDFKSNPFRLSLVNQIMLHPMEMPEVSQAIYNKLSDGDNIKRLSCIAELLDINIDFSGNKEVSTLTPDLRSSNTANSLQGQLQSIIDSMASCIVVTKEAFDSLSHEEVEFLYQNAHKVWSPEKKIESQDLVKFLELSQKVDIAKIFEAMSLLLSSADLARIAQSKEGITQEKIAPFQLPESVKCENGHNIALNDKNFTGDILFVQDTMYGKIVVGGTGTSYYYSDAAVIIDLGGNDFYFNNAGASDTDMPVSVCLDFSGDDVYNAANPFAQGAGRFGVGLLIDHKGNDKYLGKDYAQGTCIFGVGMLLDNEGDDFYSGNMINQGTGFFGAGLINDNNGNDVYFSQQYAQGVGFTRGLGALVDSSGNDFYFAGGKYPDFREPDKSFQSMSQGMGMGIRPEESVVGASGGIGVLIDQKGSDQYHGDYFSQGSGYYFSLGILYDKEGCDKYYAGRYAQGAGIHSAIGVLNDESGDDTYACSFGVSQGCGHDTGIGFLVDSRGEDVYISKTSSQGIGIEKGIGVLADFQGNDVYQADSNSQGFSVPSQNEEFISMGILADNQGDKDVFQNVVKENVLLYRANGGVLLNK
jgi:hypothetical protein